MDGTNNEDIKGKVKEEGVVKKPVKYYKGTYTSPFAMEVLAKMGFQPLPENSDAEWTVNLFASKNCSVKTSSLKNMKEWQRHSRFPKSEHLTQKSKLAKSFRKMKKQEGTDVDFLPQTFVLPDDWKAFLKFSNLEKSESEKKKNKNPGRVSGPWIIKPHDAASGHGIILAKRLSDLGYIGLMAMVSKYKKIVVSQYISNPLLIDGLKFDLRLYILVTSFTPLHIFFFSEGLARFCTEKYPTDGNIADPLAHLTNTSLNCQSEKFTYSSDMNDDSVGHTSSIRSLTSVLERLRSEGVDTNKIMDEIYDLTIKTFSTIQAKVEKAVKGTVPHKRNCFQLFGLDVLLDDNLKPWLLEVNGNPCLEPYISMEVPIKAKLVRDMYRTIGLHGSETKRHRKRESRRKGDFRLIWPKSIQPSHKAKKPAANENASPVELQSQAPVANEGAEISPEPVLEKKMDAGVEEIPVMIPCN